MYKVDPPETRTCQNCINWERIKRNPMTIPQSKMGVHAGLCSCPKFIYTGCGDNMDDDGFGYEDMEGYDAEFQTGPGFGCIHFVSRNLDLEAPF